MVTVPTVLPLLVIGDDFRLLAQAATILARKHAYLPLLEGPRVQRPDADAEVIRRNNAAVRIQPRQIIFSGLPQSTCDLFSGLFPSTRTQRITTVDELRACHRNSHARTGNPVVWGNTNVGLGLLRALRARREIVFHKDAKSPRDAVASESGHIVVCEDDSETAQVIAANYAYSLGAGLSLIPTFPKEDADDILERFYTLYETRTQSPTLLLDDLKCRLRAHVGDLQFPSGGSLTFVTQKLPWGFAFPERPCTHLFSYPDLGISIINGITAEQPHSSGIGVAAFVDPGAVDSAEVNAAVARLTSSGVFSIGLRSRAATVDRVARMIELFPTTYS